MSIVSSTYWRMAAFMVVAEKSVMVLLGSPESPRSGIESSALTNFLSTTSRDRKEGHFVGEEKETWKAIGTLVESLVERLGERIQTPATGREEISRLRAERALIPPKGGAAQVLEMENV